MSKQKFFNFPIMMMQGVLEGWKDKDEFLRDLLYYHIQSHAEKLEDLNEYEETSEQLFRRSAEYWNVTMEGSISSRLQRAVSLIEDFGGAKVFVGISTDVFWNFYNENKTDFEWECLAAFLALKSILGNKTFCKSNNGLLYARMSGYESADVNSITLSRFHRDKIIQELEDNWNLKYYSRYTKGFYFGFDIGINDLVFEAEKRRKSTKEKLRNDEKKKALAEALKRLGSTPP